MGLEKDPNTNIPDDVRREIGESKVKDKAKPYDSEDPLARPSLTQQYEELNHLRGD